MRYVILVVGVLWAGSAWAETACVVQSTGQVAETYGETQPEGTCLKNLTRAGIPANDIDQLTVSSQERMDKLKAWRENPKNPDVDKRHDADAHQQQHAGVISKLCQGANLVGKDLADCQKELK